MHVTHALAAQHLPDDRKVKKTRAEMAGPLKVHLSNTQKLVSYLAENNKHNRLMLFRKIIAAYCENRSKRKVHCSWKLGNCKLYFEVPDQRMSKHWRHNPTALLH